MRDIGKSYPILIYPISFSITFIRKINLPSSFPSSFYPSSLSPFIPSWQKKYLKGKGKVLVAQSCPALCDPTDWILPGSSVHGILQARILEWVTIPFPGYLLDPGIKPSSPTMQADSLTSEPPLSAYLSRLYGRGEKAPSWSLHFGRSLFSDSQFLPLPPCLVPVSIQPYH